MKIKIHFFSMIEILLALTVIAIGMTSVLGLFPVGLKASRQAIAQNMSADVADQIVTYMRVMGESSDSAYDATFVTSATDLPTFTGTGNLGLNITTSGDDTTIDLEDGNFDVGYMSSNVSGNLAGSFLTAYRDDDVSTASTTYPRVAEGWAIFAKKSSVSGLRRRVYFVVQGPNCTENGGNRNIDYSAMVLVWKDTVQIKRLESDGTTWSNWPSDTVMSSGTTSEKYEFSGKINVELSWPLVLPYEQRKKRYYQVVINKPN